MHANMAWGIVGVLLGGLLNGSFILPMKRLRGWHWENAWLVYSFVALLIAPWIVAFSTVPGLVTIYQSTSWGTIAKVLLFGFGWGIGGVLFGLGVTRLGLAVGYGVVLGLIAPIGTFLPLVVLHPQRLWTRHGISLMIGTLIVLVGVFFCAAAGGRRERELQAHSAVPSGFVVGLVICILSGTFSPMLNFAFVFGGELQRQAVSGGATSSMAANAIWALTLTAGFLVNAGYCLFLLTKNRTWNLFAVSTAPAGYWLGGSLMGILWYGGVMAYGMGATALGPLGGIVGWPLFMAMGLIVSNALGALSGEWKGVSRRAYGYSLVGIAFLIVAIAVISSGGGTE